VPAADPVGLEHQLHRSLKCLAVQRDREAFLETHRDFLGRISLAASPRG